MIKNKLIPAVLAAAEEEEKKKKNGGDASNLTKEKLEAIQGLSNATRAALEGIKAGANSTALARAASQIKQAQTTGASVTAPAKTVTPTVPASKNAMPTAYKPGSLYGQIVQDYIKQGAAFANQGPKSKQELADSLLAASIYDIDKGKVSQLNWDALREAEIRNTIYKDAYRQQGLFNQPEYLTERYITLPGFDYLQQEQKNALAKLEESRKKDEEAKAARDGLSTTDNWLQSQYQILWNNRDKTDVVENLKNWTYFDWLSGDRANPYDFGAIMDSTSSMSDEEYFAWVNKLHANYDNADWNALTNSSVRKYESETPALEAQAAMFAEEIARRERKEELKAIAKSSPSYGKPYTPPADERKLTGNRVKDTFNAIVQGTQKWEDKQRFINEWNAYRASLAGATDENAINDFISNFFGDAGAFFGGSEESNTLSTIVGGYIQEALHYLPPEDVDTYNVLMDEDPALAEEFLQVTRAERLAGKANVAEEYYTTRAEDPLYAALDTIGTFPKNVAGTFNTVLGALVGETDPNAAIYGPAREVSTTRQVAGQTAGELFPVQIFGEEAGTIAYNVLTSIGDMLVAKKIGGIVGGATGKADAAQKAMGLVMATESGTNTYLSDLQDGKDPLYAALHGLANGGIEMWSESGFIDSLFSEEGKFLARVGKSGGAEALEEEFSAGMQLGVDLFMSYLTDQESEVEKAYKYYVATVGEDKAAMATLKHFASEFAIDGLSGFATGAGTSAVVNTGVEMDNRATGRAIQEQGDPEKMLEIAKSMPEGSETRAVAAEIEARVGKGKKLSLRQLGKLTKTMAGELNEEMSQITNGVMEDAIVNRLIELGTNKDVAKRNAAAIRKMVFGEKLTLAEKAAVAWDDNADQVTKELSREMRESENTVEGAAPAAPEGQRTGQKWVTDMQTSQAEATSEVLGKQIDMQRAATTKDISKTIKEATSKGASKVRKGKNGKPTARKIAFHDGNAKGEGDILRFEEQDGELKMVIQTGKGENDVKAVALDSMTEAEGEGVAGLIESVNDINSSLHSVSAEDANALLATYTSVGGDVGTFVENYEKEYLNAYAGLESGKSALPEEVAKIAKASGKRAAEADEEKRKQRASAYKAISNPVAGWLGRVTSNDQVRGSGDVEALSGAMEAMTESQRMTAEAAVEFGKAVGLNVVLFESDEGSIGSIQNGSFEESTHTVYLDVNSGAGSAKDIQAQKESGTLGYAIMRTLGHEVTHYLEVASPEMYAKYKAAVKEGLKAAGEDVAQLIRGKIDNALNDGRKLTYAAAEAEVIADASEYMLQDSKFTGNLDNTLRGKVKTFVQNFMQKVKEIFSNLTTAHRESKALREMVEGVYRYTGKLQELWDASLQEVLDKGTADQSGDATEMVEEPEATDDVRFSMRDEDLNYASAEDEDFHRNGRIYDYDFLVEQKPISVVTIPSVDTLMGNGRFSRSEVVEAGKGGIPGPANEQGHKKVTNVYTGRSLTITNNSIRHGLNGDKHRLLANAQIGMVIGDVVKNGIPVNGLVPTDGNALQTYAMVTPCITEDGKRMMAVTHVDIQKNEVNSVTFTDIVHSANGRIYKNSEPVSNTIDVEGEGPYHPSRYTISISDLLRDVNTSFKSLLSQDVLEHLEEERPANGVYSAKVLYSTRDLPAEVSVREFISEAGDDVASTIEEKNALQYFRKRLDAYKAATQAVEEAEAAWSNAVAEKGRDSTAAAAAQNVVNIRRTQQRRAYNELVKIEETPHVKRVFDWTRQFITETLSGSEEEIAQRQAEAEANLAELESQYEELRAAGRTQLAAEKKRALEQQQRYARTIKSEVAEGIKERRAEYDQREARSRKYRHTRDEVNKLRRGISRKVKRLNNLRVRETDQKHVPQELQHVADLVMQTFTDTNLGRLAFSQEKMNSLSRRYRLMMEMENDYASRWDDEIETIIENLQALGEAYNALKNREAGAPSYYSLEGVELETEILQGVDAIVSNVMQMIDSANDAFLTQRNETFDQFANQTGEKLRAHDDHKVRKGVLGKIQNMLDETIRTGNMTPIYFFEHLQNQELLDVFTEMRRGQALYAQIVAEGKDFVQAAKEKHNYGAWVNDGKLTMKTGQGHVIELTREEAAEIYAIAKREQANKLYQTEHLLYGGFQYKNIQDKVSEDGKTQQTNKPHQLDKADIARIGEWLTDEQKAYADELVGFLSTTMADYGNAASMDMYGYKKFTESYYIPFHTVADQRFQKGDEGPQGENAGTGRMKNSGFTKKLQHKANQPLLVGGLTDTVADHIHKMAAYSAMVQPIENMKRLLNHKVLEPDGTTNTIRALIGQKYGKASQDYLTQLLKDANGATMSDQRAAALTDKLVGAFKRGAVMASASVVLQQPTAAARAMAYISPKYFAQNPFYRPSKGTWDEMMKYSGTAVIKDMGKFDVGMGLTASQYIADENINMFEAYQRLKADSKTKAGRAAYDRFMAWLTAAPGKADQWTWGLIWKAVKAEQAALHPEMDVNSETFLQMCGARFDDVIDHTQVYDSVLTRSNLMRSTNALHKMATSFMSEPTLSLNMLYDALTGKHNGKQRAGIIGSVVASQVLAGALAALVQAWNDDDDKRNWMEKYADRATGNILDNLNPLGMIPYVSDIVSLFEGYDVERPDMSVIADIYDYSKTFFKAFEDGGTPSWKQIENFAGTLANLVGVPAKNISREIRRTRNAIWNTDWSTPNGFNVGHAMLENTFWYSEKNTPYYQRMVTAHLNGDTELEEDFRTYMLTSKMVSEESLANELQTAIQDRYLDGDVDDDTAIKYLMQIGKADDEEDAYWTVDKWQYMKETGNTAQSYRKYDEFFTAVESGTNLKTTIQTYLDNGVSKSTLASQITSQYKPQLITLKQSGKGYADLQARLLTAYEALGYDRNKKLKDIQKWFEEDKK